MTVFMEIIERKIEKLILDKVQANKVIVISGARRVGKTFLIKKILQECNFEYLFLNGEDLNTHLLLSKRSVENYRQVLGSRKLLVIDEAQKVPEIGEILKLMVDEIEGLHIIVSGSSALDLFNQTGEPLTGRKYSYTLFPFCEAEYDNAENKVSKPDKLKQRLVFGNYPELLHIPDNSDKKQYIAEIINSYLLKDILLFENIKNSSKIINLLRLIAFQIGSEVSYQELGKQLSISKNTVEKYLDLLSKVFIIHKVEGFSRNLRKEISKSSRWYFYDNGIRNAIVANFNQLVVRNDIGLLWENYMISERIKFQQYHRMIVNNYFWRTYDQQEIDWVEERDGTLFGYEFKWGEKKVKTPGAWSRAYPESEFFVITPTNYHDWLIA